MKTNETANQNMYSFISKATTTMSALSCGFYSRAVILFLTGSSVATLKLFQDQLIFSQWNFTFGLRNVLSLAWWIPLAIGAFACVIGLIYPCVDNKIGHPHYFRRDWTSVVRCVAVFMGIFHYSTVSFSIEIYVSNKAKQNENGPVKVLCRRKE